MLKFIIGRAGTGKTHYYLNEMKNILNKNPLSAKIFVLMPSYMTYKTERQFVDMTGGQANTYFYSFQKFAKKILNDTSGENVPKISDIGRRIILRKILLQREKNQELKYFARSAKQRGFTETLAEALKELKTYDISPESLRTLTENIDSDELCDKLFDIATLSEDFSNAIEGKNYDDEDVIELAVAAIKNSNICQGAEFFIDGFVFFDPLQRKLIRALLEKSVNITIALPMETDFNHNENDEDIGLFRQSMKTFKTIRNIAEKTKTPIEIVRCEKNYRFKRGILKMIEQNLFSFPLNFFSTESRSDGMQIIEAANQRVEAKIVAQTILKIKEERNYEFKDFGILIRDDYYIKLLKPFFESYEIPYFTDEKLLAINHPLSDLARSSLDLLSAKRIEPMFYCLRTGFFDVKFEDIDLLENYVIEFGIKGLNSWIGEKDWNFYRREYESDSNEIPQSELQRIEKVNNIRKKIIPQIAAFSKKINSISKTVHNSKSATVRDFAECFFEYFENLQVPQTLIKWSQKESDKGNLTRSKEHLKIWNEFVNLLEQLVEIMGDQVISLKEFAALIIEGFDSIQMSLIPQGLNEVTVSKLEQNSLQNTKVIFILGCNEGQMPRKNFEKGLFSDVERYHLNQSGLEIHAGQIESALAEKFLLYRGFTEAKEFLCLSYSLADSEGSSTRRAPIIDNLLKIMPNANFETVSIDILRSNSDVLFEVEDKKISPEIAAKLFTYTGGKKNNFNSSVSKIEQFMECPFKHFAQYGLKLEERREHKFRAIDLGNLLHITLRKFGERMKAENRLWRSVEPEELKTIVKEIFDEIVPRFRNDIMMSNNTYQYQLQRIKKLAIRSLSRLIEFDKNSQFHPQEFEFGFGFKNGTNTLDFGLDKNITMSLYGKIDRIDLSENGKHFLVIDYKTGKKYINLIDVYCGISLQLLTYLLVADKYLDKSLPAGMLYCLIMYPSKSNLKEVSEDEAREIIEKELKMPGWVLAEEEVIKSIDEYQKFIKVKLTKSGEIDGKTTANVKTAEQFKILLKYVEKTLENAGNRIIGGDIAIKPFKSTKNVKRTACDYCLYKSVCGVEISGSNINWRGTPELSTEQIFKLMENGENNER